MRYAAAMLGVVVGAAAPAHAASPPRATRDAAPEATTGGEAPSIEIIQAAPTLSAPTSNVETPPPVVRVVVHHPRAGLVVAGAAIFGASYSASLALALFTAAASVDCDTCGDQPMALLLPVGGPFVAWLMTPAGQRGSPALWAAWSGVQAAGAAMLAAGILGHDVVEWRPFDAGPRVSVIPTLTPRSGALSLNAIW